MTAPRWSRGKIRSGEWLLYIFSFSLESHVNTYVDGFGHWVTNGVGILRIQVIHAQFVPGEQVLSAEINPEILDSHAVEPRFGEGVADFSITQSGKRLVHNEEVVGYVVGVAQGTQSRVGNFFSIFVALPGPGRSEEHTSELQSRENLVC